ncbi:MAG: outer membrane protein assembly factor [Deltaproteobacteria bacterium]|nr:outer membrane protein assembly factor [Deltaproteobacteria bacterium]
MSTVKDQRTAVKGQRWVARFSAPLFVALCLTLLWGFALPSTATATAEVPYHVEIKGKGLENNPVQNLLREVSQAVQKESDPPKSLALLKRRCESDLPEIQKVLRSFGYFRGTIKFQVIPPKPSDAERAGNPNNDVSIPPPKATPTLVRIEVDLGPRFTLSKPSITLIPETPPGVLAPPTPTETGLVAGAPYAASRVVKAGETILTRYKETGYPFPKISHREVIANFKTNHVAVSFRVSPGPYARFGPTRVTGLERLKDQYVYELIPWKAGEPYDIRRIKAARQTLFNTNLFGIVAFKNPGVVDAEGQLPMTVELKERAPRTVRLGLEYTTDYGPGFNGSWTHRNLLGMAEKLTATAILNKEIRTAALRFDKPMFLSRNNTFISRISFNDETTDAYDATSGVATAILRQQFTKPFRAHGGLGFHLSRVKDNATNERNTYQIVYVPLTAELDTRKNILNPIQGYHLSLAMAPYQDISQSDIRFFRYVLGGSTYYNFNRGDRIVVAVKAAFGQICGIHHDKMPADLRFYPGGGGSIRGYGYQMAGPLKGNTPLGGLSMLTGSLELRFKVTESIGLVPFVDVGTAYLDTVPDFSEQEMLYGAGLGLRYYTAIGPVRLDVAVPLKKRGDVDSDYQIYVSIGQSF